MKSGSKGYAPVGSAEIKVDVYAGKNCDEHSPAWHGSFEGDMGGGEIGKVITLDVSNFQPGTRIWIEEPVCPKCHEPRSCCVVTQHCGQDWKAWDEGRYS